MVMARVVVSVCLSSLLAVIVGCGGSEDYRLPPPPSADEQRDVAANPAEQAAQQRRRYLQARASLLKLYELLSEGRFEEAEGYLSQQTRDFLAHGSDGDDASLALSEGTLQLPDGRSVDIDPVEFLIGGKLQRIDDTVEGAKEHETQRRRELFVVDPSGQAHNVVMIVEGGRWVLHRTSIDPN